MPKRPLDVIWKTNLRDVSEAELRELRNGVVRSLNDAKLLGNYQDKPSYWQNLAKNQQAMDKLPPDIWHALNLIAALYGSKDAMLTLKAELEAIKGQSVSYELCANCWEQISQSLDTTGIDWKQAFPAFATIQALFHPVEAEYLEAMKLEEQTQPRSFAFGPFG